MKLAADQSKTQQTQNICITFVQGLDQRLGPNIVQMLYKCFVFAGNISPIHR